MSSTECKSHIAYTNPEHTKGVAYDARCKPRVDFEIKRDGSRVIMIHAGGVLFKNN